MAPIIIFFGAFSFLIGLGVAIGEIDEAALGRYIGNKTSGQAIDQGLYRIFLGIVVGAIYQIGYELFNKDKGE